MIFQVFQRNFYFQQSPNCLSKSQIAIQYYESSCSLLVRQVVLKSDINPWVANMLLNVPMGGGCGGVILLKVPLQNHMKTPPLAHGELQILSYTRHSDYLSREGSFSFQHQLRHGTSVHTLSSEGLVSTSHSGIPTRDVRIKYLLRDSRGDALTIKYTFKE